MGVDCTPNLRADACFAGSPSPNPSPPGRGEEDPAPMMRMEQMSVRLGIIGSHILWIGVPLATSFYI